MRKPAFALLTTLMLAPTAFAQTTPATAPATTAPAAKTPAGVSITRTPMKAMGTVNVNTASAADLAKIPGVSPAIAADIIKNRPYKNSAELVKKVKGIGPKNVKKMLPMLSF